MTKYQVLNPSKTGPHVLVPAQTRGLRTLLESRKSLAALGQGAHHAAHASHPPGGAEGTDRTCWGPL